MLKFHLVDNGELSPSAITPLMYGRWAATILADGKVACDNHLFAFDTDNPPEAGEKLMIWCEHEYFCCKVSEYERYYHH